jgi:hypothetical protein
VHIANALLREGNISATEHSSTLAVDSAYAACEEHANTADLDYDSGERAPPAPATAAPTGGMRRATRYSRKSVTRAVAAATKRRKRRATSVERHPHL